MPHSRTLWIAKDLNLREIPADGGACACATCHIHVDDVKWHDKLKIKENSLEQSLLEYEPDYIGASQDWHVKFN